MGDLADAVLNGPDAMVCIYGSQPVRMLKTACIKRQKSAKRRDKSETLSWAPTDYSKCLDCERGKEIVSEMASKECKVDLCRAARVAWGLCQNHYYQWRKNERHMVEIMGCDYEDRKTVFQGDGDMAANSKNSHQDSPGSTNAAKYIPQAGSQEKGQKKPLILDFSQYDSDDILEDLRIAASEDFRTMEGEAMFFVCECLRKRTLHEKIKESQKT